MHFSEIRIRCAASPVHSRIYHAVFRNPHYDRALYDHSDPVSVQAHGEIIVGRVQYFYCLSF